MISIVDHVGYRGGLALFWKNYVHISFNFVHKLLIHFSVKFGNPRYVYGEPVRKERPRVENIDHDWYPRKSMWWGISMK